MNIETAPDCDPIIISAYQCGIDEPYSGYSKICFNGWRLTKAARCPGCDASREMSGLTFPAKNHCLLVLQMPVNTIGCEAVTRPGTDFGRFCGYVGVCDADMVLNMEDEPKKTNLLSLVTVVVSILGSMALLGYLSIRFLPSNGTSVYTNTAQASQTATIPTERAPADWADDSGALVQQPTKTKYILHKDIQKQIGRSLLTYRGKADGSKIKLDVVVLDLDPETTYKSTIDIARAKQTFRAGDERFELISAGGLRMRVWHHP